MVWSICFTVRRPLNGYIALAPGCPDDPESVEEAKQNPEVFAHKHISAVADYYCNAIRQLDIKPVVIGHLFGGLIAQRVAGEGVAAATVAIDPAPFRGVLPLPISPLKSASPVPGNPLNDTRAVPLTFDQFRFSFANMVDEVEVQYLYHTFSAPASGVPISQAATANLSLWTEAQVSVHNRERGPLLTISGENDNTVPWATAHASYMQQEKNRGVTEIQEIPERGHSLTIDHGWQEVAETALTFIAKFLPVQR